jgi:hypothetical protein
LAKWIETFLLSKRSTSRADVVAGVAPTAGIIGDSAAARAIKALQMSQGKPLETID